MYKILVADDEIIERKVLAKTIRTRFEEECEVFEVANGRQAVDTFKKEHIQILILDIEMPGLNGIEAAVQIRLQDKECPIIFLTAFERFEYAKSAIAVQAMDYLLKPFEEEELVAVIEKAMSMSHQREEANQREQEEPAPVVSVETQEEQEIQGTYMGQRMYQFIKDNYTRDTSMQEAARYMNYSEAYFSKLFKQLFHKNFTAYLSEYRIEAAKKMLESPEINISTIGKNVGYTDSNYFAKVFKRMTGLSPSEYRGRHIH